jgi:hypothetical protein
MNNVNIASSNEEMTKTKVVDLEKLYNFVVEHFFNLKPFKSSKSALYILFAECKKNTWQTSSFPSVKQKKLGKQASLPCVKKKLGK